MKNLVALAVLAVSWIATPSPAGEAKRPEMVTHYIGFLLRGPHWIPQPTPEVKKLQEQHMAHMAAMHKAGKLLIAGPLEGDSQFRGVVVYKAASIEEARGFAEADPAVKAGRLVVEMHPWLVEKGIICEPKP